jgi:hypothetical protein
MIERQSVSHVTVRARRRGVGRPGRGRLGLPDRAGPAGANNVLYRDKHRPCPPDRVREFDFYLDGERHAMGELLGQLSERSFAQAGLLISVLVQYLNANDAGPGFHELAQRKKVLRPRSLSGRETDLLDPPRQTPSARTAGRRRPLAAGERAFPGREVRRRSTQLLFRLISRGSPFEATPLQQHRPGMLQISQPRCQRGLGKMTRQRFREFQPR